jgi:hypothetical protein
MATSIRADVNIVRHDNHTPPVSLTKRVFPYFINTILIFNTGSMPISISFDGASLLTIKGGGAFSMDFNNLREYWTVGDGSTYIQVVTGSER